jgi:N-acetylglucosamine-6-phosphate deacetylase
LIEEDVLVSVGHSSASYDQVIHAAEAGLKRATHLFNAMASFHQREPGPVGAALLRDDIYAELILDGIHVHPATAQAVLRMKGLDRVVLISDAIAAAGVSDGIYEGLGGQKIHVEGGAARLDSGALAGSTLTMDQAIRNAVQMLGLSAEEAIRIASQTAAESLGFETQSTKGMISPGKDADLIVLDDSLSVILTMVAGEVVYQHPDRSLVG